MVNNARGVPSNTSDAHGVQDVGVQRVPGQADGPVYDESGGRRLSVRAVLFHDAHLQAGHRRAERCPICEQGLEGALEKVAQGGPRRGSDEVAESGGADAEVSAASARGNRDGKKEDQVLWR